MVIVLSGQLLQLQLDLSDQHRTSPSNRTQIPRGRDGSTLIPQLRLPRTGHPDHGVLHAMITINHVDNDLFAPTLGHEVACTLGGLPERLGGAENVTPTSIGDDWGTEDLQP